MLVRPDDVIRDLVRSQGLPYGPWVELFGRYPSGDASPALPAALARRGTVGEVTSQGVLFQQTLDFLSAVSTARAVVLLLDDIHWADPASLDLLRVLARSASARPLLILATYRTDEVTRRHPLYLLLALARPPSRNRYAGKRGRATHSSLSGDATT